MKRLAMVLLILVLVRINHIENMWEDSTIYYTKVTITKEILPPTTRSGPVVETQEYFLNSNEPTKMIGIEGGYLYDIKSEAIYYPNADPSGISMYNPLGAAIYYLQIAGGLR